MRFLGYWLLWMCIIPLILGAVLLTLGLLLWFSSAYPWLFIVIVLMLAAAFCALLAMEGN